MARAALRFRRFTAAFDDAGRAHEGEGKGKGESLTDLSDLVASFLEREEVMRGGGGGGEDEEEMRREESESSCWSDSEATKDKLLNLFQGCGDGGDAVANDVKRKIRTEVEAARGLVAKNGFSEGLKRQLVISLRLKGFDAGLCESSWDRTPRRPAGAYEYVDVNVEGTRYIVEVSLAGQFKIARPSDHYTSLVEAFPPVFISRPEELQQVIRLMCAAMKQSLQSTGLLLPPWRKKSYMKAKWFSNHKRTAPDEAAGARRLPAVRHESMAEISYRCKDDVLSKTRPRAGHLSEIFSGGGGGNGSGA
ncbi:uncharacterized protein LOC115757077 [Rhodamnia argentea]|uniref:Uncharacterized protein LOC115757077 n=1 Tax=Rhodamnia argentea TaxID=178133 RepID=A0A8B8R0P5_9MYRT|nr:uncharacterized protein LOC115757077 [Rhodamnia argentea]